MEESRGETVERGAKERGKQGAKEREMKRTISTLFPGLEQEYFPWGRATLGFCPSAHTKGNCQTGPYLPNRHTRTHSQTHGPGILLDLFGNVMIMLIYCFTKCSFTN